MLMDRDAILNVDDLKREVVPVPEWGDGMEVLVREASAEERETYYQELWNIKWVADSEVREPQKNNQARLCVKCIINEKGERLFKDEDAAAIGRKSSRAIARIFGVIAKLSGMSAGAVETAAKN